MHKTENVKFIATTNKFALNVSVMFVSDLTYPPTLPAQICNTLL